ncbi:MAG: lactate utilization protein [Kiloniellales bacterium]|nr:lactate utilization protein [Kiloniellales bacterium]
MTDRRSEILGRVRRALKADGRDRTRQDAVKARLTAKARGPVPARSALARPAVIDLFVAQAEAVATSVARVATEGEVPKAVADYLKGQNLPAEVRLSPDPVLEGLPWSEQPLLKVESGRARVEDPTSVTAAVAGVAETGTLMLASGPTAPTTLNFLPENHIVVLKASQVVGPYEDAWDRLYAANGGGRLPRTVNFITGPSRTGDIEQTIQMGAHGPRRLHVILVEDEGQA